MKYILPYKTASKSAKALSEALNYPILGADIDLIRGKESITIINWGKGAVGSEYKKCRMINKPEAICLAVNKIDTFKKLQDAGVSHPAWTTSKATAAAWLTEQPICVRTTAEGRDGEGLLLIKEHKTDWFGRSLPLPDAALYTKFIKARSEYRVNVCNNRTVGVQLKVPTGTNPNHDIKTGGNGYGFRLLSEAEIPHGIRPVARAAITALGLDFGGVDLIVGVDGTAYVLEVNTAPELTPAMVTAYATQLRNM